MHARHEEHKAREDRATAAELEVLRQHRHQNLVALVGFCLSGGAENSDEDDERKGSGAATAGSSQAGWIVGGIFMGGVALALFVKSVLASRRRSAALLNEKSPLVHLGSKSLVQLPTMSSAQL